jgi:hypothetical protein
MNEDLRHKIKETIEAFENCEFKGVVPKVNIEVTELGETITHYVAKVRVISSTEEILEKFYLKEYIHLWRLILEAESW